METPRPALPLQSFTADQLQELAQTRSRSRKVRRATATATFDAWCTAIFAGLTVLCSLISFSFPAFLLGAAMCVAAYNSFRGLSQLRQLKPEACRLLALNQLFFATALILYAGWSLYYYSHSPAPFADVIASEPETREMLAPFQDMARSITTLVYATLIAVAVFAQGGAALYYFSRQKHIERYTMETPEWILQLQKAGFKL